MHFHHDVPEPLKDVYKRVVLKAPESLREDSDFQLMTLLHLKVGGERLANQNTELFKLMLEEERIFNRWLIREGGGDGSDASDSDDVSAADENSDAEEDDAKESRLEGADDYADDPDEEDLDDDDADF